MQATISAFDEPTRTGRVLLDDGQELPFDAHAFGASRMLSARLGQRVELTLTADGGQPSIASLRLITFH